MIIGCQDGPPDENKRPFSIAGAIAFWVDADDFDFLPVFGDFALGDPIQVDESILDQITLLEVPSKGIMLQLANLWPECDAISVLWDMLVVELLLVDHEAHRDRLKGLPSNIYGCSLRLHYNNGPLPNTQRKRTRETEPEPTTYSQQIHHGTDHVTDKTLFPGTMIGSASQEGELCSTGTAGILIEKGNEQRLTCSFHCWEDQHKKHLNQFGSSDTIMKTFQILQGNNPGSAVGYVKERISQTDIALAKLRYTMMVWHLRTSL